MCIAHRIVAWTTPVLELGVHPTVQLAPPEERVFCSLCDGVEEDDCLRQHERAGPFREVDRACLSVLWCGGACLGRLFVNTKARQLIQQRKVTLLAYLTTNMFL